MNDSKIFSSFRAKLEIYEDLIASTDTTPEMIYLTFGNKKAFHDISMIYNDEKDYIQGKISKNIKAYLESFLHGFNDIKISYEITESNDLLINISYQDFIFTLDLFEKKLTSSCPQLKQLLIDKNKLQHKIKWNEERIKENIAKKNLENITNYKDYISYLIMKKHYFKKINNEISILNDKIIDLKKELRLQESLITEFESRIEFKNSQKLLLKLDDALIGMIHIDDTVKGW